LKQAKSPKEFVFHRREPEIQREMIAAANAEALFRRDVVSISDSLIEGIQLQNRTIDSLFMEGSVVERVNLSDSVFGSVKLADVRLVNCDLGNLEARAMSLVRVEFINCRMTGFRAGKLECQDVLISEGDQRYSQFRFSLSSRRSSSPATLKTRTFMERIFPERDSGGAIFATQR
jgi:uncharacterized protein YjbI with pentapeptide repeats